MAKKLEKTKLTKEQLSEMVCNAVANLAEPTGSGFKPIQGYISNNSPGRPPTGQQIRAALKYAVRNQALVQVRRGTYQLAGLAEDKACRKRRRCTRMWKNKKCKKRTKKRKCKKRSKKRRPRRKSCGKKKRRPRKKRGCRSKRRSRPRRPRRKSCRKKPRRPKKRGCSKPKPRPRCRPKCTKVWTPKSMGKRGGGRKCVDQRQQDNRQTHQANQSGVGGNVKQSKPNIVNQSS